MPPQADQANQILNEVTDAVATWSDAANKRGIKATEITRFEETFNTTLNA